jgi:hypothetical protein
MNRWNDLVTWLYSPRTIWLLALLALLALALAAGAPEIASNGPAA